MSSSLCSDLLASSYVLVAHFATGFARKEPAMGEILRFLVYRSRLGGIHIGSTSLIFAESRKTHMRRPLFFLALANPMASFLGFGCDLGRDPINWDPSPISFVSRKNEEASQAHTHTHTHTLMVSTLLSLRLTDRILMRKEKQQAFSTRVRLSSSRTTLSTLVHLDKALFFKEREPLMKGEFLPQKERLSLLKSPLVPVERRKRRAGFPQERDLSPSKGLVHARAQAVGPWERSLSLSGVCVRNQPSTGPHTQVTNWVFLAANQGADRPTGRPTDTTPRWRTLKRRKRTSLRPRPSPPKARRARARWSPYTPSTT